jgi:IS30 family transposase
LVDQPEYGTNRPYFVDNIDLRLKQKLPKFDQIRVLYLEKGVAAAKIAEKFGVSKSTVLKALHAENVRLGTGGRKLNGPNDYRLHKAPYGYSIKQGKLVLNAAQLRICGLVVELIDRQGMSCNGVAKELVRRGFKNKAGRVGWDHKTVKLIYKRWKTKL